MRPIALWPAVGIPLPDGRCTTGYFDKSMTGLRQVSATVVPNPRHRSRAFLRMTERLGRSIPSIALAAVLLFSGCSYFGAKTIPAERFDYNNALVRSFDDQMLLNLVRLRYQDSILFLDVTSVVASYTREGTVGSTAGFTTPSTTAVGVSGSATWKESPTISYTPLQGEDFAKRLLAPIQPSAILLLSRSGWGLERLLICAVQQLNELPNGTEVGGIAPEEVIHFRRFRRTATLLRELQKNAQIQLNSLTAVPNSVALVPGPLPMDPDARKKAEELVALLNIKPTPTPQMVASDHAGALPRTRQPSGAPGATKATLRGEPSLATLPVSPGPDTPSPDDKTDPLAAAQAISVDAPSFPRSPAHIAIVGRSILGVMAFLAQHVEVPEEHVREGLVRVAEGADGKPFDWDQLGGRLFRVHSGPTRPKHAYLQVRYRDYWFWIDDTDLESKSTYTLIAQLFSLQAASSVVQSPMLTIPTR